MFNRLYRWSLVVLLPFAVAAVVSAKSPEPAHVDTQQAQSLVKSALRAEAENRGEGRDALLEKVLSIAPDYAPARWHSGYVRLGDRWQSIEEVEQHAAKDVRLDKYAQLRANCPNTPRAHLAAAEWCAEQRLLEQGRFHLAKVVELSTELPPVKRTALDKLGLRQVGDGVDALLVREDEIAREVEQLKEAQEAWANWTPRLEKLRASLHSNTKTERDAALSELRSISDPAAIPSLEATLSAAGRNLALEVIGVLANMKQHEASMSLVRHAVFTQDIDVRDAAIAALSQRRMEDYVPLLLAQLQSPVKSRFWIERIPGGGVSYVHDIFREGANEDYFFRRKTIVAEEKRAIGFRPATGQVFIDPTPNLPTPNEAAASIAQTALDREQRVAAENQRIAAINSALDEVLSRTTALSMNGDPVAWWQWWQQYNELDTPNQKQLVARYSSTRVSYFAGRNTLSIIPSCFAAGTPVWTQRGRVAIETVQAGDFVLSQNPETGELDYKMVLGTTVRPPTPLLAISCGQHVTLTTLGHPFWVNGYGWQMAKHMKADDVLHTVNGPLVVDAVNEFGVASAYNLIVDDFSTFFVGEQGVLVHDNTLRKPTLAIVPGLIAE